MVCRRRDAQDLDPGLGLGRQWGSKPDLGCGWALLAEPVDSRNGDVCAVGLAADQFDSVGRW